MCYVTLNLVTDYDVWKSQEESVTVELVLANLQANIANAKNIIKKALASIDQLEGEKCDCQEGLKNTIIHCPPGQRSPDGEKFVAAYW